MSRKLLAILTLFYLRIYDRTSKVTVSGRTDLLYGEEKYVVVFWHGVNFAYYPLLKNRGEVIITTKQKRGDIIADFGSKYGYVPFQMHNDSNPGETMPELRNILKASKNNHICCALDGPSGPYHIPQRFFYALARLSKRKVLPLSVEIKRKITSKKRWDKYELPLPFSRISFHAHEPIDPRSLDFDALSDEIKRVM